MYEDKDGVSFDQYRELLPTLARDFPPAERVADQRLLRDMHKEKDHCHVCLKIWRRWGGEPLWLELHHIIGGTQGRSDERANIITLCRECHIKVKTVALPQGHILFCKWRSDQEHVSWTRLAVLARRFLPELIEVIHD